MLVINHLSVATGQKQILTDVSLNIKLGTVHVIMGPNGSGKSTLAYALIGHPHYMITNGSIIIDGTDITDASPDKRAQAGMFLSFQQPPAIPGVSLATFLKEAYQACTGLVIGVTEFQQLLQKYMQRLSMNPALMYRNLNDNFSGGEKKQCEMLQLLLLKPKIAILDEIDSGLDIDALQHVAQGIMYARAQNPLLSIVLITHYQRILQYIFPDYVHILCDGRLVESGDASLVATLEAKGYDAYRAQQ